MNCKPKMNFFHFELVEIFLLFDIFAKTKSLPYCDYFKAIHRLYEHPECIDESGNDNS